MSDASQIHLVALYAAAFVNAAVPSPAFALAARKTGRYGIASGVRVSIGLLLGVVLVIMGALCAMLGVLEISPKLFEITKWAGIVVLVTLGILTLMPSAPKATDVVPKLERLGDFAAGGLVGVLNPGLFIFFLALLPQFVHTPDPEIAPLALAIAVFLSGAACAQIAGVTCGVISHNKTSTRTRWLDFAAGGALITFAVLAAAAPATP